MASSEENSQEQKNGENVKNSMLISINHAEQAADN